MSMSLEGGLGLAGVSDGVHRRFRSDSAVHGTLAHRTRGPHPRRLEIHFEDLSRIDQIAWASERGLR
jgi:hypothetical protein